MPDQHEPRPFGLMLRRPGETTTVYLAPDFTNPRPEWTTDAGSDPRWGEGSDQHWALSLPHHCGEWVIDEGTLDEVIAEAERLRAELDQAIEALRAEIPVPEGPRYYVNVTPRTGEIEPPAPWPPESTVAVQTYVGSPPRLIGDADADG